jgi:RNA polymerase sigma-70 factor (ECF subfamily)
VDEESLRSRLSRISTVWTELADAGRSAETVASPARTAFIQRYQGAVYRYLLGAVRDPDTADELFQEFALKFVRGAFRRANPDRGRFRDYLKTALCHMVADHHKRRRQAPWPLDRPLAERAELDQGPEASERQFLESWREELLGRAWEALAAEQREGAQPYYEVLKYRAEHPGAASAQMAQEISAQLRPSRPYTEAAIRKVLQRARQRFAELLIDDVAHSLGEPGCEELEQELIIVGLMPYCGSAFRRRFGASHRSAPQQDAGGAHER